MKIRETMLPVLRPVGGEEELNSIKESLDTEVLPLDSQ